MKLTKIIATIGPVSDSEEKIADLIKTGVNVFRFNFKHNSVEWHSERIERVIKVAAKLGTTIGVLIDLQGPELRVNMPFEQIEFAKDEKLIFGEEVFTTKEKGFSISHSQIISHLVPGQRLLAQDGQLEFKVVKEGLKTWAQSLTDGVLKNRKNFNIPGADFPFPVLIDRDFDGLKLAALHAIDYIALSFVRSAEDIKIVKAEMKKYGINAQLIAKIEAQKALKHLDEIIAVADVVMVARGDLGVEIPLCEVPFYQKVIIKKCLEKGIPVITATQMLESMIDKPYPTRAEVSDIANACYDLSDAVMLSGESATGLYPKEAVAIMNQTVSFNETKFIRDNRLSFAYPVVNQEARLADAAYNYYLLSLPIKEKVVAFVILTNEIRVVRLLNRYRPKIPVFVLTSDKKVAEGLTIDHGVYGLFHNHETGKIDDETIITLIRKNITIEKNDKIILMTSEVKKDVIDSIKII